MKHYTTLKKYPKWDLVNVKTGPWKSYNAVMYNGREVKVKLDLGEDEWEFDHNVTIEEELVIRVDRFLEKNI